MFKNERRNIMNVRRYMTAAAALAAVLTLTACGNKSTGPRVIVPQSSTSAQSTESVPESVPAESDPTSVDLGSEPAPEPAPSYSIVSKDGGVAIISGKNERETVVIPETINEKTVVSISGAAKHSIFTNVKKAVLPDTLREIDDYAFAGCADLEEINIPSSVEEIGEYAFRNCISLTKIEIPSSVEEIESCAFEGCENLAEITIAEGLREIDKGAFSGCAALKKIELPDSMTKVEVGAFDDAVNYTVTHKGLVYTSANIYDLYSILS